MFPWRRASRAAPGPDTACSNTTDDLSPSTFHPVTVTSDGAFKGLASTASDLVATFKQSTKRKIVQTRSENAVISIDPATETIVITSTPSHADDGEAGDGQFGKTLFEAKFADVERWHGGEGLLHLTAVTQGGISKRGNFLFQARTVEGKELGTGTAQVWVELCPE